jgi:hypothetical protein
VFLTAQMLNRYRHYVYSGEDINIWAVLMIGSAMNTIER